MREIIEKLKNDSEYYGDLGKKYLSASDIKTLRENPSKFKQSESTLAMLTGRYFHTMMLEPEKLDEFSVIDVATRNNKAYKEVSNGEIILLQKEVDEISTLADKMKSNMDIFDMIYDSSNKYEVPMIKEIHGEMWKGKCDILSEDKVYDLKTTGDISKFKSSAWAYNYDSQAYIYKELFNKDMVFIVGCKKTLQLGVYECSPEFIDRGRDKVLDAIISWRKFFGPNATEDVNNFYSKTIL
tara:strand:+ start:136 stop:855 length:720 start_codon:yes stop_codon:yes gene_type:complete